MKKTEIMVCFTDSKNVNIKMDDDALKQVQKFKYSRTLDCDQLGLRVFYKTSKNFEGILTW
jgi:hypothetical protein